jgi:hypothetical protein
MSKDHVLFGYRRPPAARACAGGQTRPRPALRRRPLGHLRSGHCHPAERGYNGQNTPGPRVPRIWSVRDDDPGMSPLSGNPQRWAIAATRIPLSAAIPTTRRKR